MPGVGTEEKWTKGNSIWFTQPLKESIKILRNPIEISKHYPNVDQFWKQKYLFTEWHSYLVGNKVHKHKCSKEMGAFSYQLLIWLFTQKKFMKNHDLSFDQKQFNGKCLKIE